MELCAIPEAFSALKVTSNISIPYPLNRPSPKAALFIDIIVKIPLVQMAAMAIGFLIIAIEFPVPQLKQFRLYRSLIFRVVILLFQTLLTILFYQVRRLVYSVIFESNLLVGHECSDLVTDSGRMLWARGYA